MRSVVRWFKKTSRNLQRFILWLVYTKHISFMWRRPMYGLGCVQCKRIVKRSNCIFYGIAVRWPKGGVALGVICKS